MTIAASGKILTMTSHTNAEAGSPEPSAEEHPGGLASPAIVRTQRALGILRLLQAGQVWSAVELAAQFDCSTRTIFRDLQLLRDCGIPIDSPRGERGFKLSHDFFWQPERPTIEEMIALVVGARMASEAMPKDMAKNLDSALAKLVGSEKPAVRQRLTEFNMRIDAPHLTPQVALPEVEYLPVLLAHILTQTHVRLSLAPIEPGGAGEQIEVIPVRLQFTGEQWMLVTSAWEGGSEVTLPLSRIERVESPGGGASPSDVAAPSSEIGPSDLKQRGDERQVDTPAPSGPSNLESGTTPQPDQQQALHDI
jgi:predicted DNA-binding transcriptional regulator YafY